MGWLALAVLVIMAPAVAAEAPDPLAPCVGADGRHAVIEAGREKDVRALFAPHVPGEALVGGPAGWVFRSIEIAGDTIAADLEGPGGTSGTLRLRPRSCEPDADRTSLSFVGTSASTPAASHAVEALWTAVVRGDREDFYRVFEDSAERTLQLEEPSPAAADASGAARKSTPPPDPPALALPATQASLAIVLVLALLGVLLVVGPMLRELGASGPAGRTTVLGLFGITAAGGILRLLADATFLREAYPLPNVLYLLEPFRLDQAISIYPQGQHLMTGVLGPLLGSNPFDAWFQANILFGTLTIPALFVLATAVTGRRRTGLIAATLLAFWPQHIRFSASESTHIGFVLWATVALAAAALAARRRDLRPFFAMVAATAAALTMRPEAALLLPAVAVLALGHGDGVRRAWRSPLRWLCVAGFAWLVLPMLLQVATDPSAAAFRPDADRSEALGLGNALDVIMTLVWPSEHNGFFDPATTPPWLYVIAVWGAVHGWSRGHRAATVAMALLVGAYLFLYSGMEPAVTIWAMGRYHLSGLVGVVVLCALGLEAVVAAAPRIGSSAGRTIASCVVLAALGCGLWWPAVSALPYDWQAELQWLIERGREPGTRVSGDTRLVVPDNRRRFRDLTPRAPIVALSAGQQQEQAAVTVIEAIESLHTASADPEALYYEGLYCWLALGPGEDRNPQCGAMHAAFLLEPVASRTIEEPVYLSAYVNVRRRGPVDVTLYRIGARKLPAQEARDLLPPPWPRGEDPPAGFEVMGSETSDAMGDAVPAL